MKTRKVADALNKIGWTLIGVLFVLLIWELIANFTPISKLMPTPEQVASYFFKSLFKPVGKYTLFYHALFSLSRVGIGYFIAAVSGIILGVCMAMSKIVKAIFYPIFEIFRPIPPIAWIPIGILWFGIGEEVKYFIIFLAGFFSITVNAYDGTRNVDPTLIGAARMLGSSNMRIFFKIILPSAVPQIFAGLQVALSTSWMAVLAAEMVRSSEGAGWIIVIGSNNGNTVQILTGMITIGIIGMIIATLMQAIEKRLCAWNTK